MSIKSLRLADICYLHSHENLPEEQSGGTFSRLRFSPGAPAFLSGAPAFPPGAPAKTLKIRHALQHTASPCRISYKNAGAARHCEPPRSATSPPRGAALLVTDKGIQRWEQATCSHHTYFYKDLVRIRLLHGASRMRAFGAPKSFQQHYRSAASALAQHPLQLELGTCL